MNSPASQNESTKNPRSDQNQPVAKHAKHPPLHRGTGGLVSARLAAWESMSGSDDKDEYDTASGSDASSKTPPVSFTGAQLTLAWSRGRREDIVHAETLFRRAVVATNDSAEDWVATGQALEASGQGSRYVQKIYAKAIRLDDTLSSGWVGMGRTLCRAGGAIDDVVYCLYRALKIDLDQADVWLQLGLLLKTHLGDRTGAMHALTMATYCAPDCADAWCALGYTLEAESKVQCRMLPCGKIVSKCRRINTCRVGRTKIFAL
eukprot:m.372731 g.372731  ORF g.372731 m.372731 type:complete len:262 (+) comp20877_c0_seq1:414-1199(+)